MPQYTLFLAEKHMTVLLQFPFLYKKENFLKRAIKLQKYACQTQIIC